MLDAGVAGVLLVLVAGVPFAGALLELVVTTLQVPTSLIP